jgi:hypothetical protein
VQSFLTALMRLVGKEVASLARDLGVNTRTIRGFVENSAKRPTLATVMRLAASAQQSAELILGDPIAAAAQGQFAYGAPRCESHIRTRMSSILRQKLEDALRRAAYSQSVACPPSVATICRAHGVTLGCAHYAFPVLVSRITASRMAFLAKQRAELERSAKLVVQTELAALHPVDVAEVSQKKLVKRLMSTSHLPKRALTRAVKNAVDMVLQPDPSAADFFRVSCE